MAASPNLKIGRVVKTGSLGVVCEGELNGEAVAVRKIYPAIWQGHDRIVSQIIEEARLMKQLSHPHIVKFFDVLWLKEDGPVYVMEMMHHHLGQHLAANRDNFPRERQVDICLQIADAVHYLHSQRPPIVRRSLSANYIWFSQDGTVKLGGCANVARLPPSGFFVAGPLRDSSSPYMPPEALIENSLYNEKADIFSLGVVMLQVATQLYPTVSKSAEDLSLLPEDYPLKTIILQCLRDDPGKRPNSGTVFRLLSEGEMCRLHVWLQ